MHPDSKIIIKRINDMGRSQVTLTPLLVPLLAKVFPSVVPLRAWLDTHRSWRPWKGTVQFGCEVSEEVITDQKDTLATDVEILSLFMGHIADAIAEALMADGQFPGDEMAVVGKGMQATYLPTHTHDGTELRPVAGIVVELHLRIYINPQIART